MHVEKDKIALPAGAWPSPISASLVAASSIRLSEPCLLREDEGWVAYWIEMRPAEGGRYVVVCGRPDGRIEEALPKGFSARTRVHEYGGGAYLVDGETLYFANDVDQRVYAMPFGLEPSPLTPAGAFRYADFVPDRERRRLICVREDHAASDREAVNSIVDIDLETVGPGTILASGHDFFASPRLSPDGRRLAWLSWDHPHMPWDESQLWVGELDSTGRLAGVRLVAGGRGESVFQPEWSPDGELVFVSDRTGWWNLYRERGGNVEPLAPMEAEFGLPQWVFRMSTYAFASPKDIICAYTQAGVWSMALLDMDAGSFRRLEMDFTSLSGLHAVHWQVIFQAGSPTTPPAIGVLDLKREKYLELRRSAELDLDPGDISLPAPLSFPSQGGRTAYGLFYPPKNSGYTLPAGELPPLVVKSHGGPTGATTGVLSPTIQYWTSRGFAVLDVNYGGSTGYGRDYRESLAGQWGVVDVDDCCYGAQYLLQKGQVDGKRLIITGSSAGGFTTLAALTFREVFHAGASYYGIGDLEALALETHKFESRYLDRLVGPYPERVDLYQARSPIQHVERLSCPLIFFQGLEDKVVPPDQAEKMVSALRGKGVPVAYVTFEGEQHGFRQAQNIIRALEAELYFYGRVFGFQPADDIAPLEISNLPAQTGNQP